MARVQKRKKRRNKNRWVGHVYQSGFVLYLEWISKKEKKKGNSSVAPLEADDIYDDSIVNNELWGASSLTWNRMENGLRRSSAGHEITAAGMCPAGWRC